MCVCNNVDALDELLITVAEISSNPTVLKKLMCFYNITEMILFGSVTICMKHANKLHAEV